MDQAKVSKIIIEKVISDCIQFDIKVITADANFSRSADCTIHTAHLVNYTKHKNRRRKNI